MKKILISVITSVALLFGFASCSGDMHDAVETDVSTLQIRGDLPGASWDGVD